MQKNNMKEIYEVEKFLKKSKGDKVKYDRLIKKIEGDIKKLPKGVFNDYFYTIRKEEKKIEIFGYKSKIVRITHTGLKYTSEAWSHKKMWCPYSSTLESNFIEIMGKVFEIRGVRGWFLDRIIPNMLEKQIIQKTPIYKEVSKYVKEYSEKEIAKVVAHLKEKFKGYDLSDLIDSHTNPNYWY